MIDLHVHSTASDGSFTPEEILSLARQAGLKVFSLTDHDTIDGVKTLLQRPFPSSMQMIPGVEISCSPPQGFECLGSIHLLGYGISVYDPPLNAMLDHAQKARRQRNPKIIEQLRGLGFDISINELTEKFGRGQTGRPHIAQMMVDKGYVASFGAAFDQYLSKGRPGYVEKYKVSCQTAVESIHRAGGIAVLAHPGLLKFERTGQDLEFIEKLISYGLEGLEVFYSEHDARLTAYYESLAREKKLIMTGGSDFHGAFHTHIQLGSGKGDLDVKSSVADSLNRRITEKHAGAGLTLLEENLGYGFKNRAILENALCHRSFLNENQSLCSSDNERLEFLGDAVVGLCIAHLLMVSSPSKKEGELSKLRAALVSESGLARMARDIDLGRFVRLGKGEALTGGRDKKSILSDTFEAVIAAVYLDSDFDTVRELVNRLFGKAIDSFLAKEKVIDYKSLLQEFVQEEGEQPPQYRVNNEMGPDHDKTFEVCLTLYDEQTVGVGKTKKAAEQDAARNALKQLKKNS